MTFDQWWEDYTAKGREDLSEWERVVAFDAWNAALAQRSSPGEQTKPIAPGGPGAAISGGPL